MKKTEISNGSNRYGCRYAVGNAHAALAAGHDLCIVRGDDDGDPLAVQRAEQIHYRRAGFAVERAGRFIGEYQLRLCNDRPCNGDTLLLPSGKLVHALVLLIRYADLFERLRGKLFRLRKA